MEGDERRQKQPRGAPADGGGVGRGAGDGGGSGSLGNWRLRGLDDLPGQNPGKGDSRTCRPGGGGDRDGRTSNRSQARLPERGRIPPLDLDLAAKENRSQAD